MARLVTAIWVMVAAWVTPVAAQEVVWVQIEAHPSLSVAQQRAQVYGGTLPDVNGFSLGGSWHGIALGPYTLPDAQRVLQVYKAERRIPQDSYIQYTRRLGQQFWPPGQDILNTGAVASAPAEPVDSQTVETSPIQTAPLSGGDTGQELTAEVAPPEPQPADETPNEARRSESLLTAEERRDLQTALQAAGFYNAAIDGAFGRGTRSSMADWQAANGYEVTGILTTLQRKVLMELVTGSGAAHVLHYLEASDRTCKTRLALRNEAGEHEYCPTEEDFDRFLSFFTAPGSDEGFTLRIWPQDTTQ